MKVAPCLARILGPHYTAWSRSGGNVFPHTPCLCRVYNCRRTGGDPLGSKVKLFGPVQIILFPEASFVSESS